MSALDDSLLRAHAAQDLPSLVGLYRQAAQESDTALAQSFFLTQAYVFALESGSEAAAEIFDELAVLGRI